MAYDVKVKIDLTKPVGNIGFGIPLILSENATKAVDYTECANMADVVAAGFANTTTVYKAAQLVFAQNNAPKKVAVCAVTGGADVAMADAVLIAKGWRQLVVVGSGDSTTDVAKVAAAVELLEGKMYFSGLDLEDSTALNVTGMNRTVLFYCDATDEAPVPVAALVGAIAGKAVGSYTVKNQILKGVAPQNLTDTQINAIHAKGGITFVAKAGDNVTSEGKVAGGEYIDIVDNKDYIVQQIAYKVQKLLNLSNKVAYDNNGIALIESAVVDVLAGAYNNGMIAVGADGKPAYSVDFALREDTAASDRAIRKYVGGNFKFELAGAIHEAEIIGEIAV